MPIDSTDATEALVEVEGFNIRVRIAGDGPPVVVLHGTGGISDAPGLLALSESFCTYAFEVPGFGTSAPNEQSSSTRELAAAISAAIVKLDIGPHAVVGTSVGARWALWHAIDATDQVEALVLVSPAAILPDGVRLPTIPPEFLLHSVNGRGGSPQGLTPPRQTQQEEKLLKRVFGPGRDEALEQAMRSLTVPTLALFGDEDFQIPPEVGRIYREILPTCFYILVHKAGPLIAHERPEAFASVVGDFLEWREQFIYSHKSGVINP